MICSISSHLLLGISCFRSLHFLRTPIFSSIESKWFGWYIFKSQKKWNNEICCRLCLYVAIGIPPLYNCQLIYLYLVSSLTWLFLSRGNLLQITLRTSFHFSYKNTVNLVVQSEYLTNFQMLFFYFLKFVTCGCEDIEVE